MAKITPKIRTVLLFIFLTGSYITTYSNSGKTHYLAEYIGGCATRNLFDGFPAVSNDERIDSTGTKIPGQFIQVDQGFFINTELDSMLSPSITVDEANVIFKNSQWAFIKETNPVNSQFLSPENNSQKDKQAATQSKIRLDFKSPMGWNRQILVGAFPYTTNGFDLGYDTQLNDNNPEDMFWLIDNVEFLIQGVPNFGIDQVFPLGIKINEAGVFSIKINKLENAPSEMNVYLNDKLKDSIHDLKAGPYLSTSEPGYIHDRFEIIFFKEELPVIEGPIVGETGQEGLIIEDLQTDFTTLTIKHARNLREIQIMNPHRSIISGVYLFDLTGNLIENYTDIPNNQEIKLLVGNYSPGLYLLKVYAEGEIINKKIIISNYF
jgi:hypothetical protein